MLHILGSYKFVDGTDVMELFKKKCRLDREVESLQDNTDRLKAQIEEMLGDGFGLKMLGLHPTSGTFIMCIHSHPRYAMVRKACVLRVT